MDTYSHSILTRWRNHFSQLFYVHGVSDVRQTERHTAEPLSPERSAFEGEMAIEELKKDTNHQVLIKSHKNLLNQGIEKFALRSINILILFRIRRNCLKSGRSRSLYLFTKEFGKNRGISRLSTTLKILTNILLSKLAPCAGGIIGDRQCGFRHNRTTTYRIFCTSQILKKKWENTEAVHQLFVDFKKACDSVRREVWNINLIEFAIAMELMRLIKVCLNETYSKKALETGISLHKGPRWGT
jgi:hypothetical protein